MKPAEDNYEKESLELFQKGESMTDHSDKYCRLYHDMAELIGDAAVRKLWKEYGGTNVTFPTKLYSKEYMRSFIRDNLGQMKPSEMAKELQRRQCLRNRERFRSRQCF